MKGPSPLQCARPHMGFVGRARTDRCQGAAAEGTFTRTWVRGQSQKMLAGAWQARATSFHVWEWKGSPYGNYLANHFVVGAERVTTGTGGFPRNWHEVRQSSWQPTHASKGSREA